MPDELGPFPPEGDGYAVDLGEGTADCSWSSADSRASSSSTRIPRRSGPRSTVPAAYPDDPLADLEFETTLGDAPKRAKLAAIETVERTADADHLTEDELLAWIGGRERPPPDPRDAAGGHGGSRRRGARARRSSREAFEVYVFLGILLQEMLAGIGAPEVEEPLD